MAKNSFEVSLSVVENGRKRPEYTLETDLKGEISLKDLLEWTKSTLIITSNEVLWDEQQKGFDKEPVMLVDGRKNKAPKDVNPLGQIEFLARQQLGPIIRETYYKLKEQSKVLTGQYIESHYVLYNGTQIANSVQSLEQWLKTEPQFKEGDKVHFINTQPYARRLELLGVTSGRQQARREDAGRRSKKKKGTMVKMPNGAYHLTTRSIKAKYKHNVNIRFTFMPGSRLGLSGSFQSGRRGKNSRGRPYLYPAIIFTVSERGIL